jgi:hypothetical protein
MPSVAHRKVLVKLSVTLGIVFVTGEVGIAMGKNLGIEVVVQGET